MNISHCFAAIGLMLVLLLGCSGNDTTDRGAVSVAKRVILVTGATGTQGGAVARELLERGFAVRALTRSPDKPAAQALAELGATVFRGDYEDVASLATAMDGAYGVFILTDWWEHGVEREIEHGKRLVDIAKKAQVQHVVYTSVANADRDTDIPHFDSKYAIEQHLRHSGLGYSIIRPVSFMNNWLRRKGEFMAGEIHEPYDPGKRHHWIAADDIGFFAGEAFANPQDWLGRAIDIAGDTMTFTELTELLADVLQRPVKYRRIGWDEYEAASNAELTQMARWFEGVGYSVDVAALRTRYPQLTTAREFLSAMDWTQANDE